MNDLYEKNYNPDVLTCLSNLSNDEVFTPPSVANQMLDLLPKEIWHDSHAKFLDPCCKSGVFLREIAKRLNEGLKDEIPDLQERLDHIFHEQLYGIAITELTSLLSRRSVYCSKYPNSKYSISQFDDASGNIRYKRIQHRWKNGKCVFCGASQKEYARGEKLETHAYEWIHTVKPEEIYEMKFDVIIGNPPYQLEDSGNGQSAKPIYQLFVNQAKKLRPRYLSMIIQARWYVGGKGLDDFRSQMLSDPHIVELVDYANYKEVFPSLPGLAGGVCYFLWDRDTKKICKVVNVENGKKKIAYRALNEYPVFIRQNLAVNIVRKIVKKYDHFLAQRVSPRKPFGIPTNYAPRNSGIPCWYTQKIGLQFANKRDIDDSKKYLDKWKLLIPKAPIAGQTDFTKSVRFYYDGNTRIAAPGECCTESWLIAGAFQSRQETIFYKSYLFTKIVRFLLLQAVVSQDVTRGNYCFVPDLGNYSQKYTDEFLRGLWDISDDEWTFIDSKISSVDGDSNGR